MKEKIKARYEQYKRDPFCQGILVGGVVALGTVLVMRPNFDANGLYIPDNLTEAIKDGGLVIARKNDVRVLLTLAPEVD